MPPEKTNLTGLAGVYAKLPRAALAAMLAALLAVYAAMGWPVPGYTPDAQVEALKKQLAELKSRPETRPQTHPESRPAPTNTLNWPDRRPIGRMFFGRASEISPKNPNGHFIWTAATNGNFVSVDASTQAGRDAFNAALINYCTSYADDCVKNNRQGAILWDLEGFLAPGLNYFGHPSQFARAAPFMNADTPAKICQAFTSRGLKIGFCLRANGIRTTSAGALTFADGSDYAQLAQEIFVCKSWGATLFYVDSNHWNDGLVLAAIAQANPDCLIIPENYPQQTPPSFDFSNFPAPDAKTIRASLDAMLQHTALYTRGGPNVPVQFPETLYPGGFRIFTTGEPDAAAWIKAHPEAIRPNKDITFP